MRAPRLKNRLETSTYLLRQAMSAHWTYTDFEPSSDLKQGDILEPTRELLELFKLVHPHFCDPKYLAFIVLTQSCDLVRRKGRECTSRYISLGAVRTLDEILLDYLDQKFDPIVRGVYPKEFRWQAVQLLKRIFNQNEQAFGLFYLHEEADSGIGQPSVAILQVSIALRREHYDKVLRARRCSLNKEFQGKLGWLVGNLYSRIGTTDWSETKERKEQLEALVEQHLDPSGRIPRLHWISSAAIKAAKKAKVNLSSLDLEGVVAAIKEYEPPSVKEEIVNATVQVVREMVHRGKLSCSEEVLQTLTGLLTNDPKLQNAIKRAKRS